MMKSKRARLPVPAIVAVALLLAVTVVVTFLKPTPGTSSETATGMKPRIGPRSAAAMPDPVVLRPLSVSIKSATHEWSADDATTPEVIEKIAHNPDEFIRLVEENERIERRQLVYRNEPAWVLAERAKASGEPLRTLTLPGLDGREVKMEVTRVNLEPSGLSGAFEGHVAGNAKSLATLAFIKGREAFTVVSPDDGIFLQGHPREPGEILVTSFDPGKYLNVPGAEALKTLPIIPSR